MEFESSGFDASPFLSFYQPRFLFIRLVPLEFTSKARAFSLSFSLSVSRLEDVSLIGLLVERLRSCGINSPARFTSLWLYSQCRNHARTDIPCCAAHSALSKHRKQRRADRVAGERASADCLTLSREQSIYGCNHKDV